MHPAGNWAIRIEDTREDENTGTLRFCAIDVIGPLPPIDDSMWAGVPVPDDGRPPISGGGAGLVHPSPLGPAGKSHRGL